MILRNIRTIDDRLVNLAFEHCRDLTGPTEIIFDNALVFPGLVNSHDHLDFNLFPQLGHRHYKNYSQWGHHLHEYFRSDIDKVLQIPVGLRAEWGMYKNLVAGVTTVVNHGARLPFRHPLIRIRQHDQNLHSVAFEKGWKYKLNNPLKRNTRCVIHTGEGTDEAAEKEIDHLIQWNFLQRNMIGVHAIAMTPGQSSYFSALVWCPVSNYFLFNTTAPVETFEAPVVLGTDSTLTGSWNIWDHLRFARGTGKVSDRSLFDMVTYNAGEVWDLPGYSRGQLPADVVIVNSRTQNGLKDFFETDPSDILLVIHDNTICLFDESLRNRLSTGLLHPEKFSEVEINGHVKFVKGDVPALMNEIRKYDPDVLFPFHENIFSR